MKTKMLRTNIMHETKMDKNEIKIILNLKSSILTSVTWEVSIKKKDLGMTLQNKLKNQIQFMLLCFGRIDKKF